MTSISDMITVGSKVELELVDRSGNKEQLSFIIVQDAAADFSQGYMSEAAPLVKAILGERAGTIIPYLREDILSIEILAVSKTSNPPAANMTEARKKRMKSITQEIENTNAMVFASSFSGKWGDYDPGSIPKDVEPHPDETEENGKEET